MKSKAAVTRGFQKSSTHDEREDVLSASTEEISRVHYPIQSDTRGAARIAFRRKVYHLGPFESPLSYMVYALWMERLVRTGEPVACKDLRELAKATLKAKSAGVPRKINSTWFIVAVLIGLLSIAGANYWGYRYFSTFKEAMVDGIPMEPREVEAIRRVRVTTAAIEEAVNKLHRTDPSDYKAIREELNRRVLEGNPNAIHKTNLPRPATLGKP